MQQLPPAHARRSPIRCALIGVAAVLCCLAGPALAQIATGTYAGNLVSGRTISGLGFRPAMVIVKGDVAESAVIRTGSMPAGISKQLAQEQPLLTNRITDFTDDGFVVGWNPDVNWAGTDYYYVAFSEMPGSIVTGDYWGDGSANREVTGLGFQPGLVMILPGNTARGRFRTAIMPDGASLAFDDVAMESGLLSGFTPDGFTVGGDWQVNEAGQPFFYVAIADRPGRAHFGTYVGDATNSRVFNTAGFRPVWAFIKSAESKAGAHLTTELSGADWCLNFWRAPNFAGGIRSFTGGGMAIGSHEQVNEAGKTYYWAAFDNGDDIADLAVALGVDLAAPELGDVVTLTGTLRNNGPSSVVGAALQVDVPAGLTLQSFTPDPGFTADLSTPDLVHLVYDLAVGAERQVVATYRVDRGAALRRFEGRASSLQADDNTLDNLAVLDLSVPSADLALALRTDTTHPTAGDPVRLTVELENLGPDEAPAPAVTLPLPAGFALAAAAPSSGSFDAPSGVWTPAAMAAAASESLVLDLVVGADQGGLSVPVDALASSARNDQDPANDADTVVIDVENPPPVSVTVLSFAADERTLLPGGDLDDVLRLRLTNTSARDVSLDGLTIHNPVTGGVDQPTQDGYWRELSLRTPESELVSGDSFAGGTLGFTGLDLTVAAGDSVELVVRGAAALAAPDGVELRPSVSGATDLDFAGLVDLEGSWPMVAPGTLLVNGMTAAQITLHPVGEDEAVVLQIGSVRNLALDVTLPANGGIPDTLIKLNVVNEGSAGYPQVISRVEAWADDGDGSFDPVADTRIGDLHWTGGQRFEASALAQPVGPAGQRVFVTVDVAEDALGGTVRLSLPAGDDVGVGMLSGNDGPIDVAVTNPADLTVSATDRVILTTAPISSREVAPGEDRVPLLHLVARNLYADTHTIRRLAVRNVTVGQAGASQPALDGAIGQLVVQRDGDLDGELDPPPVDPVVSSTTWENGVATFEGLRWSLEPDEVAHLFVAASVDLAGAADGDLLGAVVGSAGDLSFDETTVAVGDWPLDSHARYTVNGMVADQVACPAVPPVSLTANEGPVLALDITVPGNGYLDDTLETIRLQNLGSALPADIAALDLYDDQNGDGVFEPGVDPLLANLGGIGQDWVALDVDLSIPSGGRRLFAGLTVAATPTDSATVRLAVPVQGLVMSSANDGPRDAPVSSTTSLLMSTAPLLSNISFDLAHSTTEMTVIATMHVQNVGGEDVVGITPRDLVITGDGDVSLVSGPVPASLDLAQGAEGSFSWVLAGQTQGPVFLTARCEGNGAIGGQPRGSLASSSAAHEVLDPAVDLDLYPVANMPFSINRGQTGVVPMTLTLLNGGGPERADLRLERLVVTLDDGDGNPVVPAELFSHVTVNEGVNVYCNRWSLETSGQTMTLDLDPPVVVTDSEPVTLGLRLDILADTVVDRFRVILVSADDLTVVDNVSGLPRTAQLDGESFPVMSATGSIVSQATGLVVTAPPQADRSASAGQEDVELLRLELSSNGDDAASEVKVGGFAVTVTDTLGRALADASAYLSRLWVEGPLAVHAAHDIIGPADSLVTFGLLPQVTVPVGAPAVAITVHGRLPDDPSLGPLRLRLEPAATFDARDGNNAADVAVSYQPGQIEGPVVTVENPAPPVQLGISANLPPVISLGATDVLAMTLTVEHPGPASTAAVRLDTLRLDCLDLNRQPQDPGSILDGYRVLLDGEDLAVPVIYENQQLVAPLGGRVLPPLSAGTLTLRVDIEADAPAGGFELVATSSCLMVSELNLGTVVPVVPAPGRSLPASSGVARLQPPSDDVVAGWLDRLPPLLATDSARTEALRVVLTNPAPVGAAPVELASLTLRAADRHGAALVAGAVLSGVTLEAGGTVWAEIADTAPADTTLILAGATPLLLEAGGELELVLGVSGRAGAAADGLSLGILEEDLACVQPGSTTPVEVRPAAGQTFPFWTAATGLGAAALADSYINFPNPFAAGRDETRFAFNLAEPATVTLRIWTPRGASVTTLLRDESLDAGLHQDLVWDGRNGRGSAVHNGVYLAELEVRYRSGGSERLLRKVAVVR